MSPPWLSKQKIVSQISHILNAASARIPAPTFSIPDTLHSIRFNPDRLFASIARCNSSKYAPDVILAAQQVAADAAIKYFVSESGDDFAILDSAYLLGDAKFTSIAHDVGAGLANIYMHELGFTWFSNAKEFMASGGQKPDYIYSNGFNFDEVVAMESKGAIGRSVSKGTLNGRVEKGYQDQIEPWLAAKVNQVTIVSGYAIGSLAKAGAPMAEMIVYEPVWPGTPKSAGAGSPRVPALIALANYRDIFRLMQAQIVVGFLSDLIANRPIEATKEEAQIFQEIKYSGNSYLVVSNPNIVFWLGWVAELRGMRFALDLQVAKQFFAQLRVSSPDSLYYLLQRSTRDSIETIRGESRGALFEDGFAYIPILPPTRSWRWTQEGGLTPNS
jgi:hypothetical protein